MKRILVFFCLWSVFITSSFGQWYTRKYHVTDITYLTEEQLNESMKDTKTGIYSSLAIAGVGGVVILLERLIPYKVDEDENPTIIEQLLGDKGVHTLTIAAGICIAGAGAIGSITYLGRLGTIRSALNRNFPPSGSVNLSPAIVFSDHSRTICPGFTLTCWF